MNFVDILLKIAAAILVIGFFGLTIFVHELGHFIVARLCGMRVDAFSIGFGPAIVKFKRGHTVYKIGWIPFGGYVALPQLDPSGMSTIQGENPPQGKTGAEVTQQIATMGTPALESGGRVETLPQALWWQRIAVSLAGPLGNIALAFLIAFLIWKFPPESMVPGVDTTGAVLGYVEPESAAAEAGLRTGDQVLSVAQAKVATWDEYLTECHLNPAGKVGTLPLVVSNRLDGAVREVAAPISKREDGFYRVANVTGQRICYVVDTDLQGVAYAAGLRPHDLIVALNGDRIFGTDHLIERLQQNGGAELTLGVLRKPDMLEIRLEPQFNEQHARWMVGIVPADADPGVPMWMRYKSPLRQIRGDFTNIGRVLRGLFVPKSKEESARVASSLGGPIAILASMWIYTVSKFIFAIGFVRFLNINLAVLNLLPLPVLDGGHIVFALYEGITRRKIHPRVLNWLVNSFAILLLSLFVLISFRDSRMIGRLFGFGRSRATQSAPAALPDALPDGELEAASAEVESSEEAAELAPPGDPEAE